MVWLCKRNEGFSEEEWGCIDRNYFMKKQFGYSIVELILAMGLATLIFPAILSGVMTTRQGKPQAIQLNQAQSLLTEGQEAVRSIRANGWASIATDGTYHPVINGSSWSLASGTETINGLTRQVVIADVYRSSTTGPIVSSGGILDPSTKKITLTISWTQPYSYSMSTSSYLTRYKGNLTWTQTTQSDFTAGTNAGTSVTDNLDGEVVLSSGGSGHGWCHPTTVATTTNLPGSAIATSLTANQGKAYVTTGVNASGNPMNSINISDSGTPTATVGASYTSSNKMYGIAADNTYSYMGSDHPGLMIDIVKLSTMADAGYFDPGGHPKGISVVVSGSVGYAVGDNNTLYTFDISTIQGTNTSQTKLASIALGGAPKRVVYQNGYAYVGETGPNQIEVFQVTNAGATLTKKATISLANTYADFSLNSTSTRLYTIEQNGTGANFIIRDISTITSVSTISTYTFATFTVNGVVVVPGNVAIIIGSGGTYLYQVVDISNEASPQGCGGMNPPGVTKINAITPVIMPSGQNFAYILTDNSSAEFQVILGGTGGGGVPSTSGTFTSSTFVPGSLVSFNRFSATIAQPANTTIKVRVAVAGVGADQTCGTANFAYVGPNGTTDSTDYFTPTGSSISGNIPFASAVSNYQNPGSCMRYQVSFATTDTTATPVLYDMTVNYVP